MFHEIVDSSSLEVEENEKTFRKRWKQTYNLCLWEYTLPYFKREKIQEKKIEPEPGLEPRTSRFFIVKTYREVMVSCIKEGTQAKGIWKQDPGEYLGTRGMRMGVEKAPQWGTS